MRAKSKQIPAEDDELRSLADRLCCHVKELYYYNEEIEKKRSMLSDMEKEISDLEQKAEHATATINKIQAKIAHLN